METSYLWRITIPSTGEILETASSCKSPNEAVVAAKQYARKNIDPDTPIGITVLDDQKQAVQTLDTTTTTIAAELRARSDRRKTNGGPMGFEAQLWQSADKLRKNMDAAEYKHVVLGLIFLKYISDAFEVLHSKLVNGKGEYEVCDE